MRHAPAIHRVAGIRHRRLLRVAGMLGTLACLTVTGLTLPAAPALAEDCPNAALRAENNSTRLPECRAYEMVTPVYKEGFLVEPTGYTDGGLVSYKSIGSFAGNSAGPIGNLYLGTRSTEGWATTALDPPADTYFTNASSAYAQSGDLRSSLWRISRRGQAADEPVLTTLYLGSPDGVFTRVGKGDTNEAVGVKGVSADLSHIVFSYGLAGSDASTALREFVGTGNQGPLRVSVDNTGAPTPGESCLGGVSADGRVIAFHSGCNGGLLTLWARIGDTTTVAVSDSECTRSSGDPGGACNAFAAASFAGMAADGSRVFFTTTQQLVNGDIDQSNDLYECDIPPGTPAPVGTANPCASLTEISGNVAGANVEDVVKVAEDGSRVYFVARGVLATNLGTNDAAAVAGNDNLYVWEKDAAHPAGQTTFVAKLQANDISRTQSTADGRYLVFDTAGRLLVSDTDEATDVYRYDADTGRLLRVSIDTGGSAGNESGAEATVTPGAGNRPQTAMTDDASAVVFQTAEALSPADTDGVTDVYEWHDGHVSMISSGGGSQPWITSSGRDVFFFTSQPLTTGDSGTEGDIYDARVEGGFPSSASVSCSGEACRSAAALWPQAPGASGSATLGGPGNPPAQPASIVNPKPKPQTAAQKLAKALKACRIKHDKKKRTTCEKRAHKTYRRAK